MDGKVKSPVVRDTLINLDEINRVLSIDKYRDIKLTLNQTIFLKALLQGVTRKHDIIRLIWGEDTGKSSENSYHQLIFHTRRLLKAHSLPDNFLVTIPRHGVRLNKFVLVPVKEFKLKRIFRLFINH